MRGNASPKRLPRALVQRSPGSSTCESAEMMRSAAESVIARSCCSHCCEPRIYTRSPTSKPRSSSTRSPRVEQKGQRICGELRREIEQPVRRAWIDGKSRASDMIAEVVRVGRRRDGVGTAHGDPGRAADLRQPRPHVVPQNRLVVPEQAYLRRRIGAAPACGAQRDLLFDFRVVRVYVLLAEGAECREHRPQLRCGLEKDLDQDFVSTTKIR